MRESTARMWEIDLQADGVLWAINRTLFHPRGFALGWDRESGKFYLLGDGKELWEYSESEDDEFQAFKKLLEGE